jgi:hypothetical protein
MKLEQMVHIKMPYYFTWFMARLFTDQSVLYQTAFGIISPVEYAKEASHVQCKLWENRDLTGQPVITYIYLCMRSYAFCLSFFSNRHPVMDQKLNWNVRLALERK